MYNQINYFKQERVILSTTISLKAKQLASSKKLITYIQTQIKDVYHVIIDRALFDNKLCGQNVIILYTLNDKDYYLIYCNYSILTNSSINRLIFQYPELVKCKNVTFYYGLSP
jgi:hypothetical protein